MEPAAKSLSNFKNSTIFQFTVQFYGMEVVFKIMENKQTKKNKKATTQVSVGYGSRESGFQVQKAQAAATAVGFSLQSHLPPDVRENSWTSHRNVWEPWGRL